MKRRPWLAVSLVACAVVAVLGAFPVRAWIDQGRQREDLAARVTAITTENDRLAQKIEQLKDPATVEALARERYQLVRPGEEAYAILPTADPAATAAGAPPAGPAAAKTESHQGWLSRAWSKLTSLL